MSLLPLNRRARRAERRRLYLAAAWAAAESDLRLARRFGDLALAAACSDNLGRLHKLARRPVFAQGAR